MKTMTTRYRLIYRTARGGNYYSVDKTTGKRTSLHISDRAEALRQLAVLNLSLARNEGANVLYLAYNGVMPQRFMLGTASACASRCRWFRFDWQISASDFFFARLFPGVHRIDTQLF